MYVLTLWHTFRGLSKKQKKKKKQTIGWLFLANFYNVSQRDLGSNKPNL